MVVTVLIRTGILAPRASGGSIAATVGCVRPAQNFIREAGQRPNLRQVKPSS
jgi:hypothetical protein